MTLLGLLIVGAGALAGAQWRAPHASASARLENVSARADQTGSNRAGLVIRFSDSQVVTRCVSFTESEITGDELLDRSGLTVGMNIEGTVCSIENEGCPTDNCLCQCSVSTCQYWAHYHLVNGAWVFSDVGPLWSFVTNGTVEGWSWGEGDTSSGIAPPPYTFEQICLSSAATNTPTATATATRPSTPQSSQPTAPPGTVTPPQITFNASATTIVAGDCTLLSWVVWDATQVTLNGAQVIGQDRQRICPTSAQRYTLTATNAGGQVTREIVIEVTGSGAGQSPLATPVSPAIASPAPVEAVYTVVLTPPSTATAANQVAQQGSGGAAFSPLAAPPAQAPSGQISEGTLTPTVYYTLAAEPTATPRPRRDLAADGLTPTPVLLASSGAEPPPANAGSADGATAGGPPRLAVESRAFSSDLLPGYAMFLLAVAALLAAGAWVVRRKAAPRPDR